MSSSQGAAVTSSESSPSYAIKTILRLRNPKGARPRYQQFFSYFRRKCPVLLQHKRVNSEEGACMRCGKVDASGWKNSASGQHFYDKYFAKDDQSMLRKEILVRLNKIATVTLT